MSEERNILLLDVYRLREKFPPEDGSTPSYDYRIINRSGRSYDRFCITSLETGETVFEGTADEVRAYLNGNNGIKQKFEFYGSLPNILNEHAEGYGLAHRSVVSWKP